VSDLKDHLNEAELFGSFANAFRVTESSGADECFLDFLLYSSVEDRAVVVARVRVPRDFLPTVHGRLEEVTFDLAGPNLVGDCLH
jgi:hypothetical protein